jgi:hypothetical protein
MGSLRSLDCGVRILTPQAQGDRGQGSGFPGAVPTSHQTLGTKPPLCPQHSQQRLFSRALSWAEHHAFPGGRREPEPEGQQ